MINLLFIVQNWNSTCFDHPTFLRINTQLVNWGFQMWLWAKERRKKPNFSFVIVEQHYNIYNIPQWTNDWLVVVVRHVKILLVDLVTQHKCNRKIQHPRSLLFIKSSCTCASNIAPYNVSSVFYSGFQSFVYRHYISWLDANSRWRAQHRGDTRTLTNTMG